MRKKAFCGEWTWSKAQCVARQRGVTRSGCNSFKILLCITIVSLLRLCSGSRWADALLAQAAVKLIFCFLTKTFVRLIIFYFLNTQKTRNIHRTILILSLFILMRYAHDTTLVQTSMIRALADEEQVFTRWLDRVCHPANDMYKAR